MGKSANVNNCHNKLLLVTSVRNEWTKFFSKGFLDKLPYLLYFMKELLIHHYRKCMLKT